ncbi:hypothetical protein F0562_021351 [Nyssa sinensis]|uniref:CASP-like protein n=1 Tax=Nyssa sinensis TaxID=561372 RepID=A0A5J5BK97_9ASTE|nr:hypothetical protein F0562_021351 [Nyssa sinensis]
MDGVRSHVKVEASPRRVRSYDLVLRILGLAFTLVAAVVAGVNKETKIISITMAESLAPLQIPFTAKWHYLSAFVYFVVSNSIACLHAAASLALLMVNGMSRNDTTALALHILDLMMVALLFSANGAAIAVGVIGIHGNSHANWNKVCNVVKNYCRHSTASIAMSMLGSFAFLWLVVLATLQLHKKSS